MSRGEESRLRGAGGRERLCAMAGGPDAVSRLAGCCPRHTSTPRSSTARRCGAAVSRLRRSERRVPARRDCGCCQPAAEGRISSRPPDGVRKYCEGLSQPPRGLSPAGRRVVLRSSQSSLSTLCMCWWLWRLWKEAHSLTAQQSRCAQRSRVSLGRSRLLTE